MTIQKFQRVLLKLSGEALMGDQEYGISPKMIRYVAEEVRSISDLGVQTALVVGGGNIFRGIAASSYGMDRASADKMGMLATVLNSLALQDHPGSDIGKTIMLYQYLIQQLIHLYHVHRHQL